MIAKGRTEIRAEIDFVFEAYKSLICRTEKSSQDDIDKIKNTIKSIEKDSSIEFEEKDSILNPYYEILEDTYQQVQKSQIVLFCGVFSFWEKSLYGLCKYYKISILKKDGEINYVPKVEDYLNKLLNETQKAEIPKLLLTGLDELRNYFTHGTLPPKRKNIIKHIAECENISVIGIEGDYYLESFGGLLKSLDLIYNTLSSIELNK